MGYVEWIVAGLVVGILARFLLPGRDPIGCIGTLVLGVLGIYVGGRLWQELVPGRRGIAWIGSIIVAMVLLAIFRRLTYRRLKYSSMRFRPR